MCRQPINQPDNELTNNKSLLKYRLLPFNNHNLWVCLMPILNVVWKENATGEMKRGTFFLGY